MEEIHMIDSSDDTNLINMEEIHTIDSSYSSDDINPINIVKLKNISNKLKHNDGDVLLFKLQNYKSQIINYIIKIIDGLVIQENIEKYGNFLAENYYVPIFACKANVQCTDPKIRYYIENLSNTSNSHNIIIYDKYKKKYKSNKCFSLRSLFFIFKKNKIQETSRDILITWDKLKECAKEYNKKNPKKKTEEDFGIVMSLLNDIAKNLKKYKGLKVSASFNVTYDKSNSHGLLFSW